jgi:hypothetical protein
MKDNPFDVAKKYLETVESEPAKVTPLFSSTVMDALRIFPGAKIVSGNCPKCGEPWTPYKAGNIVLNVCWCEVKGKWITAPWKQERQ